MPTNIRGVDGPFDRNGVVGRHVGLRMGCTQCCRKITSTTESFLQHTESGFCRLPAPAPTPSSPSYLVAYNTRFPVPSRPLLVRGADERDAYAFTLGPTNRAVDGVAMDDVYGLLAADLRANMNIGCNPQNLGRSELIKFGRLRGS